MNYILKKIEKKIFIKSKFNYFILNNIFILKNIILIKNTFFEIGFLKKIKKNKNEKKII